MKINNRNQPIDGLRGFSVLAVVLYHFNIFDNEIYFFPGFIGVDIFFVISGYLITKSITKNNFDYFKYFENRLRRVALPLILVVTISTIFTIFFFNKDEIIQYNLTSISSLLYITNWTFWFGAKDYFFQIDGQIYYKEFE